MLEDTLKMSIDVVLLNLAPAKLRLKTLLNSVRLIVRDSSLYASLLLSEALYEAMDIDLKIRNAGRCIT